MAKDLVNVSVFGNIKGAYPNGQTATKFFNQTIQAEQWKGIRLALEAVCSDGDFYGSAIIEYATLSATWFDGRNWITHFGDVVPGKLLQDLFDDHIFLQAEV